MIKEITGIILCGGKSTRMQSNKAFLKIGELTVIEIVVAKLKAVFSDVVISANNKNDYSFLNLHIIQDEFIDKGPLSGIHAAIKSSGTEKNFVVPCDMPLISAEMIRYISEYISEKDIVLPKEKGKVQQLCGVYPKSIVREIENLFKLSELNRRIKGSVYDLIDSTPTEFIEVEGLPFYNESIFYNMNLPKDFEYIKHIFEKQ